MATEQQAADVAGLDSRASQFPRAAVGKGCIRFKRLDDLDEAALRSLIEDAGRLPAPGAVAVTSNGLV